MTNPFQLIDQRLLAIEESLSLLKEDLLLGKSSKKDDESVSRKNAALELGVSLSTIDRMIKDGTLSKGKIRSKTVIPRFQINRLKSSLLQSA